MSIIKVGYFDRFSQWVLSIARYSLRQMIGSTRIVDPAIWQAARCRCGKYLPQ